MSLEDRLYPFLSVYERLPSPVRRLVGGVYRWVPLSLRLGQGYRRFQDLAELGADWGQDQWWDHQRVELESILSHAAASCRFYRETFERAGFDPRTVKRPEDMERCPMLEKEDLVRSLPLLVSDSVPKAKRLYLTTGGSTGAPVGFYLQKGVSRPKEQAFLEAMWSRAGYRPGARLAVVRGHVTTSRAEGRIISYDATRGWLLLSSSHLIPSRLEEYVDALNRFGPEFLHAYPSAALQLAAFLERSGRGLKCQLKALLCGSERLTLPQKRLLERVFGCRVYRWYGHSERVVLAGEHKESELFHFFPQYGYVEFGPAGADGLREVIGTSFHNLVMPLIRYRTGDYVRLSEEKWLAASEIAGREQEFLVSREGRRVSLTAFNMHDGVFDDLYAVQLFQEEVGRVEFRYVAGPAFSETRLPQIEKRILAKLGDDFVVTMKSVKETEKTSRGKNRWLVSRLSDVAADPTGGARPCF